jgi:TM2 domain-containing membrane protein YozV
MKRSLTALLLSVFILPGLGHLYLGSKQKGIALVLAVNLLLLVALFFVMKLASPLIGAHLTATPLTADLIMDMIQPYSAWAKLLLAAFFALWGFSLVDLISILRRGDVAPLD